jgi:hypothetical protein
MAIGSQSTKKDTMFSRRLNFFSLASGAGKPECGDVFAYRWIAYITEMNAFAVIPGRNQREHSVAS